MKITRLMADLDRRLTRFRRKNPRIRFLFPARWVGHLNRIRYRLSGSRNWYVPVLHRSAYRNIYHCCVQKTGSQWIRSILGDLSTYQYCGLSMYTYQSIMFDGGDPRPIKERVFSDPFPAGTIVSPLYIHYDNYRKIPKPGPGRAFFVMRDPRDLVISWYYSSRYSHLASGNMLSRRKMLSAMSQREGIAYGIRYLNEVGAFSALRSWTLAAKTDPDVTVIRYEELSGNPEVFRALFDYLDIRVPDVELGHLIQAYSFKRLTGRDPGQEDRKSHLRRGKPGGWRNHFDDGLEDLFHRLNGDLIEFIGYGNP